MSVTRTTTVPMDLAEAETLTRAERTGRVARALLAEIDRLRPFERRALDAEACNQHWNTAFGELCPCSYDPDGPGPLQECPVDGDGVTFVAEVHRLRAIEAAAGALLVAQDRHVRAEIRAAHDHLVSLLNGPTS